MTQRAAGALLLALTACGASVDDRPATWSYVHAAILQPSCATVGCHSDTSQMAGLSFEQAESSRNLLLAARHVVPGDPNSPLVYQLEGIERRRMPPDVPLPAADIDLIRAWISAGAPP
jgi:hypothetical protein